MAPRAVKREDDDGTKYTEAQILEYYGAKKGAKKWIALGKWAEDQKAATKATAKANPKAKAKAKAKVKVNVKVADFSALEKGMKIQAEADGKWFPAEVVSVKKTSVKVHWIGYTAASNEVMGAERLRSKAITYSVPGKEKKGPKPQTLGGDELLEVTKGTTAPIGGQVPGTSGLRKKTKQFMEGNYLANYVQSVFNALIEEGVPMKGGTLVVSGDGRFWNPDAIQIIIKMAFANGVGTVWCGTGGLLSTPATSAVIRCHGKGGEAFGGFICSASHNPGGINDDFGIKYNCENGGPAPEKLTDKMVAQTAKITELLTCEKIPTIDLTKAAVFKIGDRTVEVFDCVEDHLKLLKKCFNFNQIRGLLRNKDFSLCYDCMSGVRGLMHEESLRRRLAPRKGPAPMRIPRKTSEALSQLGMVTLTPTSPTQSSL